MPRVYRFVARGCPKKSICVSILRDTIYVFNSPDLCPKLTKETQGNWRKKTFRCFSLDLNVLPEPFVCKHFDDALSHIYCPKESSDDEKITVQGDEIEGRVFPQLLDLWKDEGFTEMIVTLEPTIKRPQNNLTWQMAIFLFRTAELSDYYEFWSTTIVLDYLYRHNYPDIQQLPMDILSYINEIRYENYARYDPEDMLFIDHIGKVTELNDDR
jgi:hypothetical protein